MVSQRKCKRHHKLRISKNNKVLLIKSKPQTLRGELDLAIARHGIAALCEFPDTLVQSDWQISSLVQAFWVEIEELACSMLAADIFSAAMAIALFLCVFQGDSALLRASHGASLFCHTILFEQARFKVFRPINNRACCANFYLLGWGKRCARVRPRPPGSCPHPRSRRRHPFLMLWSLFTCVCRVYSAVLRAAHDGPACFATPHCSKFEIRFKVFKSINIRSC